MSPPSRRRAVLLGLLGGLIVGVGGGIAAGRLSVVPALAGRSDEASSTPQCPPPPPLMVHSFPRISFAQQGEDIIIDQIVDTLHIARPTYLDIGAHDPVLNNNTFLFYALGSRGVLVEPNPVMVAKLRDQRPGDTVLAVGVGVTDAPAADYYIMHGDGQLNTFSKEEALELQRERGSSVLDRVVSIPLVNVNRILGDHFSPGGPDVLSIDTEGMDLEILRSLDFARFRPKIICAETLSAGTNVVSDAITRLLIRKGYTVRGGTFVNTIFVANELLSPPATHVPAAPAAAASARP